MLFKAYSDNRVTNFNGFSCGIMPVLLVSDPCYMHLDLSEDFLLPKNHQSSSDGPRTTDFLLPVTIPHLTLERLDGFRLEIIHFICLLSRSPHLLHASLCRDCSAGLA